MPGARPTGYSDLDLIVVLDTDLPRLSRWTLLRALLDALPVPVDLLVYTPEEFARGRERGIGIFDALAREGVEIPTRYPNGLAAGTPRDAFSGEQSRRALDLAQAIVEAVERTG